MDEGDAERIVLWLASAHALPATDQHEHPLPAIDIKFRRGGSNSFAVLGLIGGSEDPVDSPRRSSRRRRRHPVEEAPQAVPATPEREQLPPASPVRHARGSFLRRFRGIATVVVFVILLHFITPVMGHATIRDFDSIQLLPGTTNGDLKARDHDTFDWRERHPLRFSLLAMLQDDFPAPQDFCTDRDGSTTTPTSSPWTPRADSIGAPGGALASSTPASRSGAAPKFRRDQSHQTVAPAAAARATWVILACVPSVSSTDDDFKAGDHLAFDWRDPPGVSLLTLRQSASVSPAPQDFCPDRDDHPYVVDVDSGGGLLLRGARRNAHVFCPGVALGLYPAPISGDILCDALLRMALPFLPCSDDYRLLCAGNVGMIHITAADGEHQIRLVAELQPEAGNGIHHAILLRYPQKLRVWASKEAKSPASRRPWSSDGVVALAGKLPFAAESASQACGSYSSRGHDDWRLICIRF